MSNAQTNLTTAAAVAASLAAALGAPGGTMDVPTGAAVLIDVLKTSGPFLDPRIGAAINLGAFALSVIHVAMTSGKDVSAADLNAHFDELDAAFAADAAAHPKA